MSYRQRAASEVATEAPSATVTPIMRKLLGDSAVLLSRGPADARARAAAARAYAVDHLEELHLRLRQRFGERGIGYHRAADAAEALATVRRLLGDARRVAKSKSMVAEEIGLTHYLRKSGLEVLETDIGEYIVDLEGRGPSHITAPALHLNRRRIRALLAARGASLDSDDPGLLSRHVRDVVRDFAADCDAGITGVNMAIASSGRVVVVENEGNVALSASHPRLHIAVTGLEKVVADETAALSVLEVLAASATAQPLTAFTHFWADPMPGQQRHVVFVDNGRSRVLGDPRYRDLLRCIRCGACMNGCPVYREGGGLAYGSPYMGPIGAVLSPLLWPGPQFADLPFASSLCGRCTEVCPVGIPLHRMLLDLRGDAVAGNNAAGRGERLAWRAWARVFSGRRAGARATERWSALPLRAARFLFRRSDPRRLPARTPAREPGNLGPSPQSSVREPGGPVPPDTSAPSVLTPQSSVLISDRGTPASLEALFVERLAEAAVLSRTTPQGGEGSVLTSHFPVLPGELHLSATAAIASTGSVLLTGSEAALPRLLAATHLVAHVDRATIVTHPSSLARYLGDGPALILTGASRTADIEKNIVRGIHGAESLGVVITHP